MIEKQQIKESSIIKNIWIDWYTNRVWIQFNDNGIFKYENVPDEVLKSLPHKDSIGKWFHANIRSNSEIKYMRVDEVKD